MMVDITGINLIDLVPDSIRGDPQVQAGAAAIDSELKAVTAAIPVTLIMSRIDELPEVVLDLLAWQFHVDFYEPIGLSIRKKRSLVKQSIAWHRKKGTTWAVEQVVSAVFGDSKVKEWYEYGGDPYYFRIDVYDDTLESDTVPRVVRAVRTVKNTRSWLETIMVRLPVTESVVQARNKVQLLLHNKTAYSYWGNRRRYYPLDGCVLLDGSITLGSWMAAQDLSGALLLDGTSLLDGYTQYGANEHHRVRFDLKHNAQSLIDPGMILAGNIGYRAVTGITIQTDAIFHAIRNFRPTVAVDCQNTVKERISSKATTVLRNLVPNQYLDGKSRLDGHMCLDGQDRHDSVFFKSISNEQERCEVL